MVQITLLRTAICVTFISKTLIQMKTHHISLIHAIILISAGAWGYLDSADPSPTALIPVITGIILLAVNSGVKKEDKIRAHIAVTMTLLILLGLMMPLKGQIVKENALGVSRIVVMIVTSAIALVSFIRSFINARKARENNAS